MGCFVLRGLIRSLMMLMVLSFFYGISFSETKASPKDSDVFKRGFKSYNIDFNWGPGGPNEFAEAGLWADSDPNEHIQWYKSTGVNVVQTFAVSCNGYAWYKNGIVPEQPGLKHDFLTEMVKLGHKENMLVMGYFCIAGNVRWGQLYPDESYGLVPTDGHIPLTKKYNKFLADSIKDAITKTGMDGFMIDWVWHGPIHETKIKWLDCEIQMWSELMDGPFPGKDKVTKAQELEFARRSVDRCWESIKHATKSTDPDCIIWFNAWNLNHPQIVNSRMLKEADWLMNEDGSIETLNKLRKELGRGKLINCLAAWNGADPETVVPATLEAGAGLYGFTKPVKGNLMPGIDEYYLATDFDELSADDANIAMLARAYRGLEFPVRTKALSEKKPVTVSSTWAEYPGFDAARVNDGDHTTRWGSLKDVKSAWVEIDLEKQMDVNKVKIYELADRVREFAIEYRTDPVELWKTAATGTTIGNKLVVSFRTVRGRYFRLNMISATAEPTIWEFKLFGEN
ncbi:MAG: discoidin domain-containing protein [Phycisphaerae bacterium]|nr:discoidin domain-containing protein [Phycisphaerae bacterium]